MQHPLRIAFRNMEASEALEQRIQARVTELEQICDRITTCEVVVEMDHKPSRQGKLFHVRVDISVPGRVIVVRRDPTDHHAHEDAHSAVRHAFDVARRQLEAHIRVARGDTKTHA